MNIVITMAGLGSRFKKAGYTVPKYMIQAHGKTLFHWSMISLRDFFDHRFIFIVRQEDGARDFIEDQCAKIGIRDYHMLELDHMTDGQATTALLAEKYWKPQEPLLVYNIDTYVEEGELLEAQIRGHGFIPCFEASGDHWSFVRLDDRSERAVEVREKQRISNNCTLGAYYFSSCNLYKAIYEEYYSKEGNIEKGEKYIAPLYNLMIQKDYDVYISLVDSSKVHVLGTPEELEAFISNPPRN